MIAVFSEEAQDFVAHINLGFDSGDVLAGPFLDPLGPQGPHGEELLAFFTDMINRDPAYLARLQRHYVQFKERIEGRRYAGRHFEEPGRVKRIAAVEPPMPPFARESDSALPPAPTRRDAKIGRNDPRPCGSGKKYKRCCLGEPQAAPDSAATDPGGGVADRRSPAAAWNIPHDDAAQGRQAEDLVVAVVGWRENPRHQERWGTDVQATLERNHALAFPLLRLLLMRYAPDGRQRTEPLGVQTSPFDGSGGQAVWLAVKDGRLYRIESVLVEQGEGVREAFSQRDLTKRELDGMGRRMCDADGTRRVGADYLHRMTRHLLASARNLPVHFAGSHAHGVNRDPVSETVKGVGVGALVEELRSLSCDVSTQLTFGGVTGLRRR